MALFVVACGLLLMMGGAVSLLLGFDIVLTERGSAMTIGGIVALSGGVIAVGVGMALKRLNQILASLESRAGRSIRSPVADRPVLPIGGEDARAPAMAGAADHVVDAGPPSRGAHDAATGPMLPGFAKAGLAVGASAIGAATVFGRGRSEDAGLMPTDPPSAGEALPSPDIRSWADVPSVASSDRPDEPEALSEPLPTAVPLALPKDLEEELSRALAETTVLPEQEQGMGSPVAGGRRFEDGLSALLGTPSPIRSSAAASDAPQQQDLAEFIGGQDAAGQETVADDAEEPWVEAVDEPSTAAPEQEALVMPDLPDETPGDVRSGETVEVSDHSDSKDEASPPGHLTDQDEDLFVDLQMTDQPREAIATVAGSEAPVLGTYAIGGRTYRMFADGSVEAASEHGEIERFASMDALRKHLARA